MAKQQMVLELFVGSPSDVTDERKVLEDVVIEFNQTWGDREKVKLEVLKWETHSYPGVGVDGQDVINKQIGDDYDIFLGIMWGRFGSPTNLSESGTEEEFHRAYNRWLTKGNKIQIMFYFKDAGVPPSKIDTLQLQKVQDFQKKISEEYGVLYHTFETTDQFREKVRIHLSRIVQNWMDANKDTKSGKQQNFANVDTTATPVPNEINPLANLAALEIEDNDEEDLFELIEQANDSMAEIVDIVGRMTDATNDLGEKFVQRTAEANKVLSDNSGIRARKKLSNRAADDLESFVRRMAAEIPEFNRQSTLAMETFGNIAMIGEQDVSEDPESIATAQKNMNQYTTAITASVQSLSTFRDTIFNLPRMTTSFNRARKRAGAVMDDLLNQLRIAANQSQDIEALLDRWNSSSDSHNQ